MNVWYVFAAGVVAGISAIFLFAGTTTVEIMLPQYYWTADLMKYVFSAFIATVLMAFMFWYFA